LRKREIVFAVAAGMVAAGGAALILGDSGGGGPPAQAFGGTSEMTYQLGSFDEIATTGPQDVVVAFGETPSVRAEGSPDALGLLEAVVENGKLLIRPKNDFDGWAWGRLENATFYVTVPRLDAVAVAGSGDISVDQIAGKSFEASIAGPGSLAITDMNVEQANFSIGASGDVTAAGTAGQTHVSIGGSGEVRAGGLRSKTASIAITGSGDVALTVEDDAKVSIAGSGDVDISGAARCSVTQMGSGDVHCAGGGGTDDED
jgi:hypothetical protein